MGPGWARSIKVGLGSTTDVLVLQQDCIRLIRHSDSIKHNLLKVRRPTQGLLKIINY